jgi:hypothetical protein
LSVDDDHGFVTLASYALERPQLDVSLHDGVRKLAANQTLCIKDLGMAHRQLSAPKRERFILGNRSTCFLRQSSSCQKGDTHANKAASLCDAYIFPQQTKYWS